jgi:hypothetical protein
MGHWGIGVRARCLGLVLLAIQVGFFAAPSLAVAQARIAVLIGNQSYNAKVGPLTNPHNDVALIGAALRSLGFKVTEVKDADYRSVDAAIKRHVANVRREGQGAISFVYYSGHGAADPDTKINYLIPVDVANADDEDLWNYSLNLNTVVEGLRAQAPGATHYVVFDACRNELNLTLKGQKALSDIGFVPIAYTPGVMVAYATAPGRTASDKGAGGGTYAKTLAAELVIPGVEAMTMFRRVALKVNREIGQDPWMSASTLPEVFFAGAAQTPSPRPGRSSDAAEAWDRTKDATNTAVLELFISSYKDTYYAGLARLRIEELQKRQIATAILPEAPATQPSDDLTKPTITNPTKELPRPPSPVSPDQAKPAIAAPQLPVRCLGIEVLVANERRCLRAASTFRDCDSCPEMVVIPAGEFMMGSPPNEEGSTDAEVPQHRIAIAKPFAVGRFSVTRGEFTSFVRETNYDVGDKCITFEEDSSGTKLTWDWKRGRSFRAIDGAHRHVEEVSHRRARDSGSGSQPNGTSRSVVANTSCRRTRVTDAPRRTSLLTQAYLAVHLALESPSSDQARSRD